MDASSTPPAPQPLPPSIPTPTPTSRNTVTAKLIFIALLVLFLQAPLYLINSLQEERRANNTPGRRVYPESGASIGQPAPTGPIFETYRMVNRALKHSALVLSLVFAAFFLFEAVAGVKLHAVHYGLIGAAMCLFYLALLALGEVIAPGLAYVGAAVASSALVVFYSVSILRSSARAAVIGLLLASVHGILYVVLRMEAYALLAGTAALFVGLGAVMFFTRNIDWHAQDAAPARNARGPGA